MHKQYPVTLYTEHCMSLHNLIIRIFYAATIQPSGSNTTIICDLISPPENDSFRKDLCFSPDVFFPTAKSPRYVGDRLEILHDGQH